jgi:hypothetical protein
MKHIKLLLAGSLMFALSFNYNTIQAQGIKDSSLYFMSNTSGLPSPYRKPGVDTLSIHYNNQDTIGFRVSGQKFFKTGNKIYVYNLLNKEDTVLLYDYDLIQGDTFVIRNSTCLVDSVKSIQYEDGKFYKEWYLSGSRQITWMENMGTSEGWIWHLDYVGDGSLLEAICHNNELIYWNFGTLPNGGEPEPTCNFDSLQHLLPVAEINYQNQIQIYPNPAGNEIHIQYPENSRNDYQIQFTDVHGRLVFSSPLKETKINTSDWPQGIYFLRIQDLNNDHYETHKIIISR